MHGTRHRVFSQAWLVVALLWVVGCLNYLDRVMLITMRISIKEVIAMTDAQFALLTTVFLFVYGVLSGFGGYLSDRVSPSRIVTVSLFVWSLTTWLTAHATTFNELLLTRALMGVSEAAYFPAAVRLIAIYHGNATRSLANGIHLSGVMVGSALGGLGGLLAEHYDWTFAFRFFGGFGIAYTVVLLLFLRDARPDEITEAPASEPEERASLVDAARSLFRGVDFPLALLFWALLGITSWAFTGWMPTYLGEHFHLAQGKAGLISTLSIHIGALIGMVLSGAWADAWTRRHAHARVWVSVIGLAICIPCVWLVATTGVLGVVMAGLVVYGASRAFPDANMMPILFRFTERRYWATGYGLLNASGVFAGGATVYVGGVLRDAHVDIRTIFFAGSLGLASCAALLWRLRPAEKR